MLFLCRSLEFATHFFTLVLYLRELEVNLWWSIKGLWFSVCISSFTGINQRGWLKCGLSDNGCAVNGFYPESLVSLSHVELQLIMSSSPQVTYIVRWKTLGNWDILTPISSEPFMYVIGQSWGHSLKAPLPGDRWASIQCEQQWTGVDHESSWLQFYTTVTSDCVLSGSENGRVR